MSISNIEKLDEETKKKLRIDDPLKKIIINTGNQNLETLKQLNIIDDNLPIKARINTPKTMTILDLSLNVFPESYSRTKKVVTILKGSSLVHRISKDGKSRKEILEGLTALSLGTEKKDLKNVMKEQRK